MKIFSAYKTTDKPWGGANNFLRALWHSLNSRDDVRFVEDAKDADIAFFNQMSGGPGQEIHSYKSSYVRNLKKTNPRLKIVMRAINLDKLVSKLPWWKYYLGVGFRKDRNVLAALRMADFVIFQSHFQKKLFAEAGFAPREFRVIHNGAAKDFKKTGPRPSLSPHDDLVVLSVSFSGGLYKKHPYIADLSKIPGVKMMYVGTWPETIDAANVDLLGVLPHNEIIALMQKAHYLFHPSSYDICPNAVIESLYNGMPVIYNPALETGSELAGDYGLPYNVRNPQETIDRARRDYIDMTNALSNDFEKYGIDRAAQDYYEVFSAVRVR